MYTGKHLCWSIFFNKNEDLQVYSWQCCEVFKYSYFEEHLWTAAFESFSFYVSLNFFLHEQITSYIESEEDVSLKTKQEIPF